MPNVACSRPAGNGGCIGVPCTACRSATGIVASRPANADSGVGITVFVGLKKDKSASMHYRKQKLNMEDMEKIRGWSSWRQLAFKNPFFKTPFFLRKALFSKALFKSSFQKDLVSMSSISCFSP